MLGKGLKKIEAEKVYMTIEYIIATYTIAATVFNLLNMAGVMHFYSWIMKPTFFGSGLLVLLLLQYGLIHANRKNKILEKIRPYIMGIIVAGIVSSCRLSLCYVLLLVLGYFLFSGFQKKYSMQEAALMLLTACVGIEIYSVMGLLQESAFENSVGIFLQSVGPDVLFVLAAIIYGIAVKSLPKEETGETESERAVAEKAEGAAETDTDKENKDITEETSEESEQKHHGIRISDKVLEKLKEVFMRIPLSPSALVRYGGGALCIVAAGLFLYYAIAVGISVRKIGVNEEEVYLLEHCEDDSLVLTVTETENPSVYNVSFEKYEGRNNQKVFFREIGEDIYQIVFLESGCALEVNEEYGLCATPAKESAFQWWVKEVYKEEPKLVRFLDVYGIPLYYSISSESKESVEVSVGNDSGGYELFVMEKTIWDEYATRMVISHYEEFMPTILLETVIVLCGGWAWIIFVLTVLAGFLIIYLRRIIGDKLAALYAVLFLYMLAYESVSAIILLYVTFGIQCYYAYTYKKKKQGKYIAGSESKQD